MRLCVDRDIRPAIHARWRSRMPVRASRRCSPGTSSARSCSRSSVPRQRPSQVEFGSHAERVERRARRSRVSASSRARASRPAVRTSPRRRGRTSAPPPGSARPSVLPLRIVDLTPTSPRSARTACALASVGTAPSRARAAARPARSTPGRRPARPPQRLRTDPREHLRRGQLAVAADSEHRGQERAGRRRPGRRGRGSITRRTAGCAGPARRPGPAGRRRRRRTPIRSWPSCSAAWVSPRATGDRLRTAVRGRSRTVRSPRNSAIRDSAKYTSRPRTRVLGPASKTSGRVPPRRRSPRSIAGPQPGRSAGAPRSRRRRSGRRRRRSGRTPRWPGRRPRRLRRPFRSPGAGGRGGAAARHRACLLSSTDPARGTSERRVAEALVEFAQHPPTVRAHLADDLCRGAGLRQLVGLAGPEVESTRHPRVGGRRR